jgi:hypothetical protein
VALAEEIEAAREAAKAFARPDEEVVGVVPTEPAEGVRVYLCAYENGGGESRAWLALDGTGAPVDDRRILRDAASIAALCELAEESAGGGDLPELRARLAELRATERPEGIEEAEEAAARLEAVIQTPPRLATPAYLDAIGAAAAALERALGGHGSPFAEALTFGMASAEEFAAEVEGTYRLELV